MTGSINWEFRKFLSVCRLMFPVLSVLSRILFTLKVNRCGREVPSRKGGDESPQIIYIPLVIHFFVGDASGTEVSVKGFRAGVPRRCEGTVGEAPSVREG